MIAARSKGGAARMDEILGEFIAETLETLEALSGEIVAWERDPTDRARLDAFFRFFHTVKGSCGFLNLPRFERLAHAAEDVLADIRRGTRTADPAMITAVLAVMDRIGMLARRAADAGLPDIPEAQDDALLDALHLASDGYEIFTPPPAAPPVSPPARQDMAQAPEPSMSASAQPVETALPDEERQPADAPRRASAPRSIRLPLALIDQLMNGISDMVLARNDLARRMRDHGADPELESSFERLSANVADLRDMISKTRMQRVDRLYAAIPRMVRDLTRDLGKKVRLELDGGDVEMDREMIEMVLDPLTHIVRNALDHGIETPGQRRAAGKDETGALHIVARQSGNQIVVEVADDGRGIDRAALVDKAVAARLCTAAEAAQMSDADRLALIFHPGLSTAREVTAVSGRGVGMDVVRANIEQIGGVIGIESLAGRGTTITLRVPLTLTIIPGLIIRSGAHFFAMPRGNVVELLHENSAMVAIERIGGAQVATIRGERYALIALEDVLRLDRVDTGTGPRTLMVIRSSVGRPYVLGVESVESNEELVIRPAPPAITAAGAFAGMTLPDNGQPMLLLDAAGIAQIAGLPLRETEGPLARPAAGPDEARDPTIQALMYREGDGRRRLMPLGVVDRVEDLPADRLVRTANGVYARIDDRLLPALNAPAAPAAGATLKALRLHDGHDQLCYLIDDVIDIIDAPARIDVPLGEPRLAGLVMVEDAQYEMIDPFAIFAEAARADAPDRARPVRCHIADPDDPWMRNILATLLVQAGYEVSIGPAPEGAPDIILRTDTGAPIAGAPAPVLTLSAAGRTDDAIYRYDRAGLMAAIAQATGRAA